MTAHDLEIDLRASDDVRALVCDDAFAIRLYAALCNVEWTHADGRTWSCTWRYAGSLVADLRDRGENYMAFYCAGDEGEITDDVASALGKLGWTGRSLW